MALTWMGPAAAAEKPPRNYSRYVYPGPDGGVVLPLVDVKLTRELARSAWRRLRQQRTSAAEPAQTKALR